jgi:Holliday junction DNA helicase RuvB
LGKTTLAGIVANELGLPMVATSGPAVDNPADLAGLLVSLDRPTVVFIDEIHRLKPNVEEMLYTAMEDGRIDILVGEGPGRARAIPMVLEPFVLVGATTRAGMLGGPLRDRFGYIGRLELYGTDTLASIVSRSAALLRVDLTPDAAAIIASRSRGTPRVANKWLRRVRDVADSRALNAIDVDVAAEALELFGVDDVGLDKLDRRILTTLVTAFNGGPVGLNTLAAAVNEEPGTLEEVHEPYLMRVGLINRTPRGRMATAAAYTRLGRPVPTALAVDEQLSLGDEPRSA